MVFDKDLTHVVIWCTFFLIGGFLGNFVNFDYVILITVILFILFLAVRSFFIDKIVKGEDDNGRTRKTVN